MPSRQEELPLFWIPGRRNFYYASEKRDAEIVASAVYENDPRNRNPGARPFNWANRTATIPGARPTGQPYYENQTPKPVAVQPPVERKFKDADQQRDWATYKKFSEAQERAAKRKQVEAPKPPKPVYEAPRTVWDPVTGQEVQERFYESYGLTHWPLMIQYPQEQAPAVQVPQGAPAWHEYQGTQAATQIPGY